MRKLRLESSELFAPSQLGLFNLSLFSFTMVTNFLDPDGAGGSSTEMFTWRRCKEGEGWHPGTCDPCC